MSPRMAAHATHDNVSRPLEWNTVVLCGYLDTKPPSESRVNRSLVYVGMTRATHRLVLSASGKHEYLADLERQ
ncbi:MAG TPA: ATP-binding domain-containing protein [Acidimicrobiales bacterium]|nr:ATP-binding domain-containing protein [Acidimicrobiales bacterium]